MYIQMEDKKEDEEGIPPIPGDGPRRGFSSFSFAAFSQNKGRRKLYLYFAIAMSILLILALALGLGIGLSRARENGTGIPIVVQLDYASYSGIQHDTGVSSWKGMRYAAPPTGSLRFAGPQSPPVESSVQDATNFGDICISTGTYPIPKGQSEDCLFLDVFAPTKTVGNGSLPVYVFIQGGGYNALTNTNYDGTGLIKASDFDMVVVTFNYRVGPYGFLASKEADQEGCLNAGLKDMIKVLQWVQKYIKTFGGDPGHVTIGGDSAGAGAVTLLLTAYGAGGQLNSLFHAAAAESQSFGPQLTVSESQYQYDNLTQRTNCGDSKNTLLCLRNLDVDAFQQQNKFIPYPNTVHAPLFPYGPTIDNNLVPDYTINLFTSGKFMNVPVIFGDDTNEGTIFTPHNTSSVDDADAFLLDNFPNLNATELSIINSLYLSEPDEHVAPGAGNYWEGVSTAYGEMRYICPGIFVSTAYNNLSTVGNNTASWNYHYAVLDATANETGYGTEHTIEINAIWGPAYVNGGAPRSYSTSVNDEIVPLMQGYWTSFIRSYNPNTFRAPGTPEWLPWSEDNRRLFIRTNQTHMETAPADQITRCETLASMSVYLHQ